MDPSVKIEWADEGKLQEIEGEEQGDAQDVKQDMEPVRQETLKQQCRKRTHRLTRQKGYGTRE